MCLFQQQPRTLAIIGNGFDMAHGYKTDYQSFVKATSSPALEKFKCYCEKEQIDTWYLFEDNIRTITQRLFQRSMEEDCNFEENRREIQTLNEAFREIQRLLLDYLSREISRKPFLKKHSIEACLSGNSAAINFNYTRTAEAYVKTVFYVHGSLAEQDILLGYDEREEPCLAQFEDMRWSKRFGREALAFRRFFLYRKHLSSDSGTYRELLDGLERYQHWDNSGRGLEEEMKACIPQYKRIERFLKQYRSKPWPDLDYGSIRTIVVLGHGIEADRVYLRNLLERCKGLSRVAIFRYDGETEESYQSKRSFFTPYCSSIDQVYY